MKVTFVDALTVSEYFELARYGQIDLFEGGRPRQFTETATPSGAGYTAHLAALATRRVILDDDDNSQNVSLVDPTAASSSITRAPAAASRSARRASISSAAAISSPA